MNIKTAKKNFVGTKTIRLQSEAGFVFELISEQTQNNLNTNNIPSINVTPLLKIIHLNVFLLNLKFDQITDLVGIERPALTNIRGLLF